jgi:hypothetical protein
MSWFNRRPKIKPKPKQVHHHHGPIAEQVMKEAKERFSPEKPKKTK